MNYREAREYLDRVALSGSIPGLDSIRILLHELGDPQDRLKFVHIAGTNGKGSVMAYLASILKEAGYRVGRYVSPALFCYEERFQINGEYISQDDVTRLTDSIAAARSAIEQRGEAMSTVFEAETAMAFLYFAEQSCDLVLLETGMGGREDATNVVTTSILEIISSISMDHMQFLGTTLREIAWHKAGIIKPGTPVVSDLQPPEAARVLEEECMQKSAKLCFCDPGRISNIRYGLYEQSFDYVPGILRHAEAASLHGYPARHTELCDLRIHMAGTCQIRNAALALEAAGALIRLGYRILPEHIRNGLEHTIWEGRFQVLCRKPLIIIDGAHNPDAAAVLMNALNTYFEKKRVYYVFGVFSDKEYDRIISITASRAEHIFTVQTKNNSRALPAELLTEAVQRVNPRVTTAVTVEQALDLARQQAEEEDVILVFGSLSFLSEAKDYVADLARDSGQRQLTASNPNPCASSRSVYQMGDWTPADTNL